MGHIDAFHSLIQNNASLHLTTEVSSTKHLWFAWYVRIPDLPILNENLGPISRDTLYNLSSYSNILGYNQGPYFTENEKHIELWK